MPENHFAAIGRRCRSLFLPALLAGCASNAVDPAADAGSKVCVRDYPTGSNIQTTRCTTAQTEAERLQNMENARRTLPPGPVVMPRSGSGG